MNKPEKLSNVFDGIGNVVGYYPDVRHITGSINSAIYLCQVYYWSREAGEDGWVSRTQREIEESTGLSRREQETAKALLVEQGLIDEQCRGKSNRTHLKFNREVAIAAWNTYLETGFSASDSRKQKRSKSTKTNLKNRGMAETDKAALHVSDKAKSDRSNPCPVELAQNRQSSLHKNDNGGNRQTALYVTDTSLCTLQTNPLYTKEFKDLSLRGNSQILERGEGEKKASQIELASNSQEGDRNSTEVSKAQEFASTPRSEALGSGQGSSAAVFSRKTKIPKPIDHFGRRCEEPEPWLLSRKKFDFHPAFVDYILKQYLPTLSCYEGKSLTIEAAQAWINEAEYEDKRRDKVALQWKAFERWQEEQELREQAIAATAAAEPPTSQQEYMRRLVPPPDWDRPSMLTLRPRRDTVNA